MTSRLDELAARLLERLDRELARQDQSTAAVGGITKTGNDLEALLEHALRSVLHAQERSLKEELRARKCGRGAGSYARILAGETVAPDSHPVVGALAADLKSPQSRVLAFIDEVRNANVHPDREPRNVKGHMSALAAILRPVTHSG